MADRHQVDVGVVVGFLYLLSLVDDSRDGEFHFDNGKQRVDGVADRK